MYTRTAYFTDSSSHVTCVKLELQSYSFGIGFEETKLENMPK